MTKSQIVAAIIILAFLPLVYYAAFVPRSLVFILTPAALQIRGDLLYARTIPRSALLPQQAKIVNSGSSETVHLQLRTNGVGLPNYQSGWFSTNMGKALLFTRPGRPMIAIPTTDGYTLLLSPQNSQKFLEAVREPECSIQSTLAR